MAISFTLQGQCFQDMNGNGQYDSGTDLTIPFLNVTLYDAAGVGSFGAMTADASGVYNRTWQNFEPGVYVLKSQNPADGGNPGFWKPASSNFIAFTALVDGQTFTNNFGWASLTCFRRPSSWVWRVCFWPGRCVYVTFHKRGVPYFCARYPGTTINDYNLFQLAPSLGRHVRQWYYHRPYLPAPVLLG